MSIENRSHLVLIFLIETPVSYHLGTILACIFSVSMLPAPWHALCLYTPQSFFYFVNLFCCSCVCLRVLFHQLTEEPLKHWFYRQHNKIKTQQNKMNKYKETLDEVVRYLVAHGKTRATCDNLETMLPAAWSAYLIADALDVLSYNSNPEQHNTTT